MRILVVDDDEPGRAHLGSLLGGQGHEVVEAADGSEALQLARARRPDCIVSDILMPGMDGYRLCCELRKDDDLCDTPFIFYAAGSANPADRDLADDVGADRLIPKPAEPAELIHAIDEVCAESRERRAPCGVPESTLKESATEGTVQRSDVVRTDARGAATGIVCGGLDIAERVHREVSDAALTRLTDAVLSEDSIEGPLEEYCARLAQTLRMDIVGVVIDSGLGDSVVRGMAGPGAEGEAYGRAAEVVLGLAHRARDAGMATRIAGDETRTLGASAGTFEGLALPLTAFDEMGGALVLTSARPDSFDDSATAVLQSAADRLALVLLFAEHQQRLRLQAAALEAAASAIMIVDADGVLVWANQAYEGLAGRTRLQTVGHTLPLFLASGEDESRGGLVKAIEEGQALLTEVESQRGDGTSFYELVHLDPVVNRAGEVTHFVVVREDTTERKRLAQLKSDFLSIVSHELRTPLTSIIGYADLMLRQAEARGDERERLLAQRIRSHGNDMQELVEELLEVSHLQADPFMRLSFRRCDISETVRRAAEMVMIPDSNELVFDIPEGLPWVVCDPEKFARVVSNLVSNAVKYTPDGGPITVSLTADEATISLSVSDTGIGIDEADASRIFERFTQGDMSASREFGGFGLGLFIVKTLVEAHGGRIDVHSVCDEGSTFTVTIPIEGPERQG